MPTSLATSTITRGDHVIGHVISGDMCFWPRLQSIWSAFAASISTGGLEAIHIVHDGNIRFYGDHEESRSRMSLPPNYFENVVVPALNENIAYLKSVRFTYCRLTQENVQSITRFLERNTSLTELDLSDAPIDSSISNALFKAIRTHPRIHSINISHCSGHRHTHIWDEHTFNSILDGCLNLKSLTL